MARTKQTARKSSGGKAPRKQLATNSAQGVRNYFLSQQTTGFSHTAKSEKKIFVNYENTFREFLFQRVLTNQKFAPHISLGRVCLPKEILLGDSVTPPTSNNDLYMRVDFISHFDGNSNDIRDQRPPLDAVFVLDISGSMSSPFPDDTDHRSKLSVAVESIIHILKLLNPTDRASVALFNTAPHTLIELSLVTENFRNSMITKLRAVRSNGGTALALGLEHGYNILREANTSSNVSCEGRMQRVFFLTDMESDARDESDVLALARKHSSINKWVQNHNNEDTMEVDDSRIIALSSSGILGKRKSIGKNELSSSSNETPTKSPAVKPKKKKNDIDSPIFLTLIGIAMDLSMATVDKVSAILGAKYISVMSASELQATVADEFNFDILPTAFNIKLTLPEGIRFEKAYGSAELNTLKANAKSCEISSEFPVPLNYFRETDGGLYLFKLIIDESTFDPAQSQIHVSWIDPITAHLNQTTVDIQIPNNLTADQLVSSDCDVGIRKATVLVSYVDMLTKYVVTDNHSNQSNAPVITEAAARELLAVLSRIKTPSLILTEDDIFLANEIPESVKFSVRNAARFHNFTDFMRNEMTICNDASLSSNNQNIMQTLLQIEEVEHKEIEKYASSAIAASVQSSNGNDVPRGMICPISLTIMSDPVFASDGHSYDRNSIEQWLRTHNISPVTNLPLPNKNLIPNHSLKAVIQDYLTAKS
jgi:hypothetical protein